MKPKTLPFLRWSRLWWGLGYLLVAGVVVISLIPVPELPDLGIDWLDKLLHLAAYAFLMTWFVQLHPPARYALLAAGVASMGVGLELLQALTQYRSLELLDMTANALGVVAGWGLGAMGINTLFLKFEAWWFERDRR